jgi:hypothetical protein
MLHHIHSHSAPRIRPSPLLATTSTRSLEASNREIVALHMEETNERLRFNISEGRPRNTFPHHQQMIKRGDRAGPGMNITHVFLLLSLIFDSLLRIVSRGFGTFHDHQRGVQCYQAAPQQGQWPRSAVPPRFMRTRAARMGGGAGRHDVSPLHVAQVRCA